MKYLLIHPGALGDVITAFPAILRLKESGRTSITLLCQNPIGNLAHELGIADQWLSIESAWFSTLFTDEPDATTRRILEPFQAIILFSFSHTLENQLKRITQKPVYRIPPRPEASLRIPVTIHLLRHLSQVRLIDAKEPPYPDYRSPRRNEHNILIHPGSGSPKKNWFLSRFLSLSQLLRSEGMLPEFVLGPAEAHLSSELGDLAEVHKISNLLELVSLLKTSGGLIGNDSGVSHLAGFLGVQTIVIFGPSDPFRWKPWGRAVKTVTAGIPCVPCFETQEKICHRECLEAVLPENVLGILMASIRSIEEDRDIPSIREIH